MAQDRETNVSTAYMLLHGNFCYKKSVTQKCCSSHVSTRDEHTLPAAREAPNTLVVAWSGNEARHGSRNVTLHRLRLSAYSRDLSQLIVLRTPSYALIVSSCVLPLVASYADLVWVNFFFYFFFNFEFLVCSENSKLKTKKLRPEFWEAGFF